MKSEYEKRQDVDKLMQELALARQKIAEQRETINLQRSKLTRKGSAGMPRKYGTKTRQDAWNLRQLGYTYKKIASNLGISEKSAELFYKEVDRQRNPQNYKGVN